ncbi:Yip1 family protein [Streptacidiphilus sp. MAP12-16]|uniref:Yip1 family protein n=1 Tax=Streptacidiphilus sp. MAP12-16 TaxID=3156300 RepID=UPI003518105E
MTTYRAGQSHPQVGSERLAWRPLLAGIYRHPERTFAQMRWHQVWSPALIVSAVYGALVVFGFGTTRDQVLHSTFSLALTIVLSSAVGFILAGLMFGGVTHVLARRLGGDGAWAPTIGFAMLITWTTDTPRLLFSFFLAPSNAFVQVLGWGTWLLCAGLLAAMVRQMHDLPWGKAAGAAAMQLIALLIVIKLPTLG